MVSVFCFSLIGMRILDPPSFMTLSVLSLLTVLTLMPEFAQYVCSRIFVRHLHLLLGYLRLVVPFLPAVLWACWARGAVLGAGP